MSPAAIPNNSTSGVLHQSFDEGNLRTYVVTHINEAIESGWIKPYYQPVIRTLTGKLCGFEALARWDDPTHGLLSPAVFIQALEETRLIHLLDCCIIRQVCQQYNELKRIGGPLVPVSFNLSRLDFDLCDIFSVVEHTAFEFGVPRRMLNIEITESVLGTDTEFMTTMLNKFQEAGYQVWMDDFGSGFSTLNVLKDFAFDELKIDMEFLNRFGEKSKIILASVVDMAKKLGIQTLAEGVETREHRDYLRSIGCEKMQGYLFGKPEPLDLSNPFPKLACLGYESLTEQEYLNEIGAVNTLSLSERDLSPNSSTESYMTSMPLAVIEYSDDKFWIIDSNQAFREGLASIGVTSIEDAEDRANNMNRPFARHARNILETTVNEKFARFDFVFGDITSVMRARHVTTQNGKTALLFSFGDTIDQSERRRHDRMGGLLSVIYSIYDHVDIIHLDDAYYEPVYGNINLSAELRVSDMNEATERFIEQDVYPEDRQRYRAFMDYKSMVERITETNENYIVDFFRVRQHGGDFSWKMFSLFYLSDQPGNLVMLCIRSTHWKSDNILQAAYDTHHDDADILPSDSETGSIITDGSIWRALSHDKQLRLFWKDANRRFVNANQAFLDYYGFDSIDCIVGKTDEDMGWHVNPAPFQQDELSVLEKGEFIENARGHCIVHGEIHDIVASKYPIYRNGHIVGLVGYFIDINEDEQGNSGLSAIPMRDELTGVLNYTGLEAATWKFVDTYKRLGIDFAMISINVDNFETLNNVFGSEFGEKVLKRVADELVKIAGHQRIIAHVFANRFVILAQDDTDEELQAVCDDIEQSIMKISQIDGKPCTIYALAGFARFSKHGDVEAMKRYNRDRRLERRANWSGSSNDEDLITSSLL